MEYFSDEASLSEMPNLGSDEVFTLRGLPSRFLPHWTDGGVDLQLVLYHLPWYPPHVSRVPCEDIRIDAEEGEELEFLFVTEAATDVKCHSFG